MPCFFSCEGQKVLKRCDEECSIRCAFCPIIDMQYIRFRLPLPPAPRPRILPVFLPYAGCPHRCLYCAQDVQSGSSPRPVPEILEQLDAALASRFAAGVQRPVEVAFYGGTFTLLPRSVQLACLNVAQRWRNKGIVSNVRCSTRPDALRPERLPLLREAGLDRIEVGVQSFDDRALNISKRGYDGPAAAAGCMSVIAAGLELGIQLLPGMPGVEPAVFLDDVRKALELRPATLRFYPCLVIRGTPLAARWHEGAYTPWTLEDTINFLGQALRSAWEANVPVIRLSLAPEPGLEASVLAGPRHPALGSLIQSQALFTLVADQIKRLTLPSDSGTPVLSPPTFRLRLPDFCRGFFAGHQGRLLPRWQASGIDPTRVQWHTQSYGELFEDDPDDRKNGGRWRKADEKVLSLR